MAKISYKIKEKLPQNLIDYIDVKRGRKYWLKKGLIFVHIPKSAGVSISHAIYGRTLGHLTINKINQYGPKNISKIESFAIIRDPVERIISAYNFAKKGGGEMMKISNPKKYQIKEFKSFEKFLFEWLIYQKINQLDYVFTEQNLYIAKDERIVVNELFRLDQLEYAEEYISNKLKKKVNISNLNKTYYSEKKISSEAMDMIKMMYYKDVQLYESIKR